MARLLKDNELIEHEDCLYDSETELDSLSDKSCELLVPVKEWLAKRETFSAYAGRLGLYFEPDDEPEAVADDLDRFDLVAVNFPKFMDGRGYSISRILRDRYGFKGEIRAKGDVLIDQLFYMKRCGFSCFALRDDQVAEDALKALDTFTLRYQGCSDDPEPLYRKRA